MAINITDKVLSISPYVSTHWSRIAALHMKGGVLAVTLIDGDTIHVPGLSPETIDLIFQYHAEYLQKEEKPSLPTQGVMFPRMIEQANEPSVRFAFGDNPESIGSMMQHNPALRDAPDLPADVLQKIGAITRILAPTSEAILPVPEANCNCFHCQIARVVNPSANLPVEEHEEVQLSELDFQQWTIEQTGDRLYLVTNRLDDHEKYSVFLGEPVGCTCGKAGCEHILAVLKS